MVKIKNDHLLQLNSAVAAMASLKLPPKTALKVKKLHRTVSAHTEDVDAVRKEIVERYAEKDENGKPKPGDKVDGNETVRIAPDKMEEFKAAMKELGEQEFEVPVTLTLEEFGPDPIAPNVLILLGDVLKDD